MKASGLLTSCAIPAASVPTVCMRCVWRAIRSKRRSSVRSRSSRYWPTVSPRASRTWSAVSWIRRSPVVRSSVESGERCSASRPSSSRSAAVLSASAGVSITASSGRRRSDAAGAPRIASAAGLRSRIVPTASASTTPSGRCSITSRRVIGNASRRRSRKTPWASSTSEIVIPEAVRS
jgi:hypothetical protein